MAYTDYLDTVQKMYIGYYQRPADSEGLVYWAAQLDAHGGDQSAIIAAFSTSAESTALYGEINEISIGDVVDSIYQTLFNRAPDDAGKAFYVDGFNAGTFTPGTIVLNVLNGATGEDALAIGNKLDAANLFTETVDPGLDGRDLTATYSGPDDAAAARAWLADVTWNPLSVPNQTETTAFVQDSIADPGDPILPPPLVGLDLLLDATRDILVGTAGNDVFIADVVQNVAGAQVDSLATGDNLKGGAGDDVLEAQLTEGVFLGGGNMPVEPRTTGIEVVKVEALFADMDNGGTDVFLNAKHMLAVENIGSWYSDANLIIQDMTTQDATGLGSMRPLSGMTVTMDHTGNDDSHWDESDLAVYFDQDYLNPDQLNQSQANWWLLDEDAEMEGLPRLNHIDSDGLIFTVDGVQRILRDPANLSAGTHEAFVANLQDELQAMIAAGLVPADTTLTLDYNLTDRTFMDNGAQSADIPAMVLNTNTDVVLVSTGFSHPADLTGQYDVYGRFNSEAGETQRLSINVDLEKVGRAGEGGDLIIGSMSKDPGNHWNDDMAGRGIDAFDVTVFGGVAESSSLASLSSTNNTLREVIVTTDPLNTSGDYANLTIGNSNTRGYALKDVQTFNSTTFLGDLTLTADLTGEVVSKYMNLGDVQEDPAADNIAFNYSTGIGNDTIDMVISADNLANDFFDNNVGTTTREDFNLNISTADGDDKVTLSIDRDALEGFRGGDGDGQSDPYFAHWYENSKLNANLNINTGDGNDTISKPGSGDVIMNAGSGDDIVYADNSGTYPLTDRMATFVFNVDSTNSYDRSLQNLESDANDTGYRIFNGELTVTFKGFESTVDLLNTNGLVSDLQVNQSIKDAINNDGVLSSLLIAKDGPGNTLVVESLIDGNLADDVDALKLSVELSAPTTLTPGEVVQLNGYYGGSRSAAQLIALMTADIATFDVKGDYDTQFATFFGGPDYEGVYSNAVSDNTITPGPGNDDIVLGTGFYSNDTVVYTGFGNGTDSIVNFDTEVNTIIVEETVINPSVATSETFTATFADIGIVNMAAMTGLTFDGDTIWLDNNIISASLEPDVDIANTFINGNANVPLNPGYAETNWVADWVPGTNQVNFTSVAPGNFDNVPTVLAVPEVFTVDFTGTAVVDVGINVPFFDGTAITYVPGDLPAAFAANAAGLSYADWTAVDSGAGVVTFTAKVGGAVTDATAADFLDTYVGGNLVDDGITAAVAFTTQGANVSGVGDQDITAADFVFTNTTAVNGGVVISAYVDGTAAYSPAVPATFEEFTVNFANTIVNANGTDVPFFDGTTIDYVVGDGAITLAANVVGISYANWTAVNNLDGTVTFTADAAGAKTDATAANFLNSYQGADLIDDGITAAITGIVQGADAIPQVGTVEIIPEVTIVEASAGLDYLDFSSYNVKAVAVNGTVFEYGVMPVANADTGKYITMVESTTNDGYYTINLVNLGATAATTDNVVTLIGVADFGVEQPFVAANFII